MGAAAGPEQGGVGVGRRLLGRLVDTPGIDDPVERRRTQLHRSMLLGLIILGGAAILDRWSSTVPRAEVTTLAVGELVLLVSLLLTFVGRHRLAALITVGQLVLMCFVIAVINPTEVMWSPTVGLAVLMGCMLLELRTVGWFVAFALVGTVVVVVIDRDALPLSAAGPQLLVEAALIGVSLAFTDYRNRVERDRLEREADLAEARRLELLGRVAGGVAHDFNNLLTVILGNTALARRGKPQLCSIDEIHQAAERAADLVAQLLAYSRRQVLLPQPLGVAKLLAGIEAMLSRLLGETVALRLQVGDELWPVLVDPGQLERVLINLVTNARDAMAAGGELTITGANRALAASEASANQVKPGDYVELAVRDRGAGMTPDTMRRAFEPFYTTKQSGTGLGLAMVQGILKQSGGNVRLASELGRGTTITLLLPRAPATASS